MFNDTLFKSDKYYASICRSYFLLHLDGIHDIMTVSNNFLKKSIEIEESLIIRLRLSLHTQLDFTSVKNAAYGNNSLSISLPFFKICKVEK